MPIMPIITGKPKKSIPPEYADIIAKESAASGVPAPLIAGLIEQESGWNPKIASKAGAQGLGQFMPATAKEMGIDPLDPQQAIHGTASYLKQNHDKFGDWNKTLAAYNAGPGAVEKFGGIPPYPETQNYVPSVLSRAKDYGYDENASSPDQELGDGPDQQLANQAGQGMEGTPKKRGVFDNFFTGRTTPGGVDEYGVKRPDIKEQSTLSKILTYLGPMAYGAANDVGLVPGLMMGLAGSSARRQERNAAENARYKMELGQKLKEREAAAKAAQPTNEEKFSKYYNSLSPADQDKFKSAMLAKNPLGVMSADSLNQYRKDNLGLRGRALDQRADEKAGSKDDKIANRNFQGENSLRNEFNQLPTVKNYKLAELGVNKVRAFATSKSKNRGFDDVGLIYAFNNVLDPNSIVKEGEFKVSEKTASFLDGLGVEWNKIKNGEKLNDEQRAQILNAAELGFSAAQGQYDKEVENYSDLADSYGYDVSRVIRGFKGVKKEEAPTDGQQPAPSLSQSTPSPQAAAPAPKGPKSIYNLQGVPEEDQSTVEKAYKALKKDPNNEKARKVLELYGLK